MRRLWSTVAALLLSGCIQEHPLGPSSDPADEIGLVPATLFLEPGGSVPVSPTERLETGGPLTWQSSRPAVATVSGGVVTAVGEGAAEISAKNGRGRGTTRVRVVPPGSPVRSWRIAQQGLTAATLLGIWSATPALSFAVGQTGTILRTDDGGAHWIRMAVPDSSDLVGVWGTSPENVYAVGTNGTILHFDGGAWTRMSSPTHNILLEVWGLGPNDIYVVGVSVALRYDGTAWRALSGVEGAELWAVWGTDPAHIVSAGQNGVLYRLEGSHWSRLASPTDLLLLGLWGTAANDLYAVGIQGLVLHWDGVRWTRVTVPTQENLFAVWGKSSGEILAVGERGTMVLFNGSVWTALPQSATGENLRAVHAAPGGGFMVAGWNGTALSRRSNGTWVAGTTSPNLFGAVAGPGSTRYAVGGSGAVFRSNEAGAAWTPLPIERIQTLYGVANDAGKLLMIGDAGTIQRYDGIGWSDESFAARLLLRSIWLDQESGAGFIVGEQGVVLRRRRAGERWTEVPGVTTHFLRHVFGIASFDVYAVGDSGTVVHWNGLHWSTMPTPTSVILRGVWASGPDNVFAVGGDGVILRYDGTRWYRMPVPARVELRAVWGTGPTDVYAVGEQGILLRFNGALWSRMISPTFNLLLAFESRSGGVPTVVGSQGLVLEGIR